MDFSHPTPPLGRMEINRYLYNPSFKILLKMNNKLKLAGAAFLLFAATACKKTSTEAPPTTAAPLVIEENDPLYLGNPTNARLSAEFSENYLMREIGYSEAYSASRGIPVWVAWHLQTEDQGPVSRQDDFRENPRLPASYYDVRTSDYTANFDKGHNCPSEDRTNTVAANSSTFLMTNMIPQAPRFNQGPWADMESYIRTQVLPNNEAYIYMGNYGAGGKGNSGVEFTTIGFGNVTVPKMVYKIVVIMPKGTDDRNRIDTSARVLAVDMPNDNTLYGASGANSLWRSYMVPIDSIEARLARAGRPHNFLTEVAKPDVRTYLKKKASR
ncbi:MAG: DNA/RNA non-specific endonuclease [Chitinophagaceae bacterium]|nr:MAG: DNA/RNA non-specific endonuclease [Chitinophagaceae bacterium]